MHLNEFFVEGSSPEESHVLLNITEPSTPEERGKGYFFAICEIFNGDNDYILKYSSDNLSAILEYWREFFKNLKPGRRKTL